MVVTIGQVVIQRLCFSGVVFQSVIFLVRFAATEVVGANLADWAGAFFRWGLDDEESRYNRLMNTIVIIIMIIMSN